MIGFSAYAEGPSSPTNPEIGINNLYTVNVSTGLGKAGSGINYNCDVFGKPNATRIQVFLYLQRFVNGAWTDVDMVSKSVTGQTLFVYDIYPSPVNGGLYRTEAHVITYSGVHSEDLYVHSATIIYNS